MTGSGTGRWGARFSTAALVAIAAATGIALAWTNGEPAGARELAIAAVLTAIFAACARYPLLLAPRCAQELSAAPGIAAAILLPPPLAVLVCGVGQAGGLGRPGRHGPTATLALMATAALQGGAAASAYTTIAPADAGASAELLALLGAGLAYFFAGALALEGMLAAQSGDPPFRGWLQRLGKTAQADISLLVTGGLVAMLTIERPWTLPLVVVPIAIIYRAYFHQQADLQAAREQQKQAEADRARLTAIVEATPDFVATADATGQLQYANAAGRRMLGLEEQAPLEGISIAGNFSEWRHAVAVAMRFGSWTGETRLQTTGGELPVSQVVVAHFDRRGQVSFISTIARDITDRKRMEEELVHLATHDTLTGVFNRRRFEEELAARVADGSGQLGALLFIDLDDFKDVNDRFGHQAGDAALQGVAAALRDGVAREGDFVARLGGDEFALLITRAHPMQAELAAHRALNAVREFRLEIQGEWVGVGGSVGVATFQSGWTTAEEVMARADAAMYAAKQKKLGVVVAPVVQERLRTA